MGNVFIEIATPHRDIPAVFFFTRNRENLEVGLAALPKEDYPRGAYRDGINHLLGSPNTEAFSPFIKISIISLHSSAEPWLNRFRTIYSAIEWISLKKMNQKLILINASIAYFGATVARDMIGRIDVNDYVALWKLIKFLYYLLYFLNEESSSIRRKNLQTSVSAKFEKSNESEIPWEFSFYFMKHLYRHFSCTHTSLCWIGLN